MSDSHSPDGPADDPTLRDRLTSRHKSNDVDGPADELVIDDEHKTQDRTRQSGGGLRGVHDPGPEATGSPDAGGHGAGGHGGAHKGALVEHGDHGHTNVIEVTAEHATDIDPRRERAGEMLIAAMLVGAGVLAVLFTVVYFAVKDGSPYQTPLFGLSLGGMLLLLGVAPIMYVKYLVPAHLIEGTQERHDMYSTPEAARSFKEDFAKGAAVTGLGRRTAIKLAGGFAGTVALLPAVVPLLSLGRFQHKERALATTPFKSTDGKPVRLITQAADGFRFIKPGDLPEGGLVTVQPEGHPNAADSPAILIRMRPGENKPAKGRENYAWENSYVAYSAICTHAGCPVKLYEQQTHNLLCPCHQSTFLANEGCKVIFGPAHRPLPQLPITVDAEGYFVATGDFSDPIGPSYWERDA